MCSELSAQPQSMTGDLEKIPLCRSNFLQDLSIELGLHLKSLHFAAKSFKVHDNSVERNGDTFKQLVVIVDTWNNTQATLAVSEDHTLSLHVALLETPESKGYKLGFFPRCEGFNEQDIVQAFRDSVSLSTRLSAYENPLPQLRDIWKHKGTVQTSGSLKPGPAHASDV